MNRRPWDGDVSVFQALVFFVLLVIWVSVAVAEAAVDDSDLGLLSDAARAIFGAWLVSAKSVLPSGAGGAQA